MQCSVAVTKEVDFRGKLDEFSNVYEYTGVGTSAADINGLADAVVAAERPIFSADVRFKRVRIWGEDNLGRNVMLLTRDLSGTGAIAADLTTYRELSCMVRWPLEPRVSATADLGNPFKRVSRYLRKYLHTATPHGYSRTGSGTGTDQSGNAILNTYANAVRKPVAGVDLCAPNGDLPTAGHTWSRFMEHRQFHRGRKE